MGQSGVAMIPPPPPDGQQDDQRGQSSGARTRSGRDLALAAAVVAVAVAIASVGTWLTQDSGDAALTSPQPSSSVSAPSTAPTDSAPPTPADGETERTPTTGTPTAATQPAPTPTQQPRRTALQQAAGLRADGSAVRVPRGGSGHFAKAKRSDRTSAKRGRLIRFDVAVEKELDIDPDQAALLIAATLDDQRSWRGLGEGRFTLVPAGTNADLHAYIATPKTTDRLCRPYRTLGRVSCQNGSRVVFNAKRWVTGSPTFGQDVTGYRRYLVNHEFGHALGHRHVQCPGRGRLAPVMVQQTKGLGGCRPNPWPSRTEG